MNIRDLPRRLTPVNTQISIPFLLSSRGYGLLWHNTGLTELNPAQQKLVLTQGTISDAAYVNTTFGNSQRTTSFAGEFSVSKSGSYAFQLDNASARYGVEIDGQVVVNYNHNSLTPTAELAVLFSDRQSHFPHRQQRKPCAFHAALRRRNRVALAAVTGH